MTKTFPMTKTFLVDQSLFTTVNNTFKLKFNLALYNGNALEGWYLADDEDLVQDISQALAYPNLAAAKHDAVIANAMWDLELSQTFMVVARLA